MPPHVILGVFLCHPERSRGTSARASLIFHFQFSIFHLGNPAPGNLNNGTGGLAAVGNYGYSWSATDNSDRAYSLFLSAFTIHPYNTDRRGRGFLVRCLRE